jgi:superfamily I DNA/RNA helicase
MNEIAGAVAAAQQLLASYEATHPEQSDPLAATPIDDLVAWQGIAVARFHPADYPPGTLGWLEPGEDLIWLSMVLDEPVRRFTLAHELGHWVLHRRAGAAVSGPLDAASLSASQQQAACTEEDVEVYLAGGLLEDELLRPGQSYSPHARRERAADAFAAALLAPLDRVCALWLDASRQAPLDPEYLAAHFGITLKAMLGRLAEALHARPLVKVSLPHAQEAETIREAEAAREAPQQGQAQQRAATSPKPPDPWQQAAIVAPTPALVVAGPGSGKTSTLVGRVRYLIEEQGIAPQRLLALTFSNKAAREMRERIAGLLGTGTALPTVSTFHTFCAELLRLYAPQVGLRPDFTLLDTADGYFLLRRLAGRLPLRHYGHLSHPELHFATLLGAISRAKDELATPADYLRLAEAALASAHTDEERLKAGRAVEVAQVYRVYQEALAAQGDADFGDLILLTVRFLQTAPDALTELRERYQQILVDEFQDMNRASGVLLKLLAGERANIWVVGDQDQAIYRFRGASPANIGQFHRDYPGAQVLPLSRNYRSLVDIVAAAGAFRDATLRQSESGQQSAAEGREGDGEDTSAPERKEDTLAAGRPGASTAQEPVRLAPADPIITLATAPDEQGEIDGLVTAIRERYARGVPYRDQVVLCRTREHARIVIEGLERAGLPVGAGGSLLEQPDVKDVLAIVALLAEPSGMGLLRAARQPDHPIPHADLLALFAHAQRETLPAGILLWQLERLPSLSPEGFAGLVRLAEILADLRTAPDAWTLLARYIFIHTRAAQRLLLADDPASRQHLDHLRGLLDLARRFDAQERERLAGKEEEVETADKRWERFLEYLRVLIDLRADDGGRREAEDGEEAGADLIRVMTVHASKGLEFPVVYLPRLAHLQFPSMMRGEAAPLPPGLDEDEVARNRQHPRQAHLLDEACLFYVGITRARDELILSRAERYKKRKAAPSDFLAHIESASGVRLRRVRWDGAGLLEGAPGAERQEGTEENASPEQASATRAMSLSVGELETYLRCPRQYAYRYVYGFQPTEQGYRQFYECVQRTVHILHERFAASASAASRIPPGQTSETASVSASSAQAAAEGALHLEAARELFADHWQQHGPLEHPFADAYFAHGLQVVERAWSELAGISDSQAQEAAPDADKHVAARLAASSRLSQRFDVHLDGQTIQVTVDRLEDERAPLTEAQPRPVRLVRHRLSGKNDEKPEVEVRHILYALAQEQRAPDRPVQVYEHNLSTGALTLVPLDGVAARNRRADLAEALAGLRARRYPPKLNRRVCLRCAYFMICPAE